MGNIIRDNIGLVIARSATGRSYKIKNNGKWITWEEADNYITSNNRHECSICHDCAPILINGDELLSNFCPNCGANMREKD